MKAVMIHQASAESSVGGKLAAMALDYMAYPVAGSKEPSVVERTLQHLWRHKFNRFSHRYAFEARLDGQTAGMMICMPAEEVDRLTWKVVQELLKLNGWSFVQYSLRNLRESLALLSIKDAFEGEFHIAALAALPEARGFGIGTKLLHHAEELARSKQFKKTSLSVRSENDQAVKLYERMGYRVVQVIKKKPYHLFRMVKPLPL
ncbi:GNAT family N-acetyltransferase [Gorillibacterium sp. CAU 1737]|uniref:GNAT family N-acetyltransferase n=1 Tax=Gorillibacterium sp. CAU 1737 TaxID=3140362 RepID=UPI00325FFED2